MLFYILLYVFRFIIIYASKCNDCKKFTELFAKELERTKKFNHGGGNSNWEEKTLPKYVDSEIRLHEMIEGIHLQKDEKISLFLEEIEDSLEKWWYFKRAHYPSLHYWLCVQTLEICCLPFYWGPQCKSCHTQVNSTFPCTGNGFCLGEGTRGGSGRCICHSNSYGKLCDQCDRQYYLNRLNSTHVNCLKCDDACNNTCTGLGPDKCDSCGNNFFQKEDGICYDIDECQVHQNVCEADKFCTNTYGNYKCTKCHSSCIGCAVEDQNCTACNKGFKFSEEVNIENDVKNISKCEDIDECAQALSEEIDLCKNGLVCKNNLGSFECIKKEPITDKNQTSTPSEGEDVTKEEL